VSQRTTLFYILGMPVFMSDGIGGMKGAPIPLIENRRMRFSATAEKERLNVDTSIPRSEAI
jgi:hypothetical protein